MYFYRAFQVMYEYNNVHEYGFPNTIVKPISPRSMSTKVPKSIASLLKTTSLLRPLISRVEMLRHATEALHSSLPASLHAHCQVANIEGHTLSIVTDSSAWAAKLRYLIPALLEKLNRAPSLPSLAT